VFGVAARCRYNMISKGLWRWFERLARWFSRS